MTSTHHFFRPSARRGATLTAFVLVAVLTAACSASAARRLPARPPTAGVGTRVLDGRSTTVRAAAAATAAYANQVGSATAGLTAAVTALGSDAAHGDTAAARADELTAQADFDRFRVLESSSATGATNGSALDQLDGDTLPGASFGGLHAVERDLWATGPLAADVAAVAGQAPVAQLLLDRRRLGPEAIVAVAVGELDWVVDTALPVEQERYSGLGLVDVAATEQAAAQAFAAVAPLARSVDPAPTGTVTAQFAVLDADVAALGAPTVVPDAAVGSSARLALSRQVDATASTLARLGAGLASFGTAGAPS